MVKTPLGPWTPGGDLFLTPAWGMLGVGSASCESGWAQTESLGVKKRLRGWRNQRAWRESLSACGFMFTTHNSWFPPQTPHIRLQREQSWPLWAPAHQACSALLSASVLAASVHLGTQTAHVGVLQSVGVVCGGFLSLCCQVTLTLFKKHWPHFIWSRTNRRVNQNHSMNPARRKRSFWPFSLARDRDYWNEKFPISTTYWQVVCFGKY